MGTDRDKAANAQYYFGTYDPAQYVAAYKSSAMIRRAIDLPAEDACREWRGWQAESTEIGDIEAEEKRLGIQEKVLEAGRQARLFGGAAIVIGTGEADTAKPLNPERVKKGGIKYLTVLSRDDIAPGEIDRDVMSPTFGMPVEWTMTGAQGGVLHLHPSRLVLFHGVRPLASSNWRGTGWGDSVIEGMLDALKRVDTSAANVDSLLYEAKIDVIRIPDFMSNLEKKGAAYEEAVLARVALAAKTKGINGTLVLDKEDEYDQKSASFAGLPDVIDRFMQLASAASGIPMTLLFGISPGGMNATGESDIRLYYDRVKVHQTLTMQPAMSVLDEALIWSALGSRPDDVYYNWRPLWQQSAKEMAEIADKLTAAAEKVDRMGLVSPEALGKAVVNALTEGGAFPGLEGYVNDFPVEEDDLGRDDTMPGGEDTIEGGEDTVPAIDAAPRTLYVRRDVKNAADILKWAKGQGFKTTLPADDLHVTIAFSRAPVDWMDVGDVWESEVKIAAGGARLMEQFGDARVLLFASSHLAWRHEEIKRAGATWDHADYQPHITISYADDAPDIADVEPYRGEIILGPEIFEEINEKWMEGIPEE
jgi:phage-related protein (TIGR01555 family)